MKKFVYLMSFCLLGFLASASQGGTLNVKLHYTGSGTVDGGHKIFVIIFNTPDFASGGSAMPVAVKAATSKDETVTFSDLTDSTVYAAASYDPTGNYDGQSGPPPSGSSLGMYSKKPGTPSPINIPPGKTTTVTMTFDDSHKMP